LDRNIGIGHREPQYSLVCIIYIYIYIDKVVQYIYVSDIEAIEACIRFVDDDDDLWFVRCHNKDIQSLSQSDCDLLWIINTDLDTNGTPTSPQQIEVMEFEHSINK